MFVNQAVAVTVPMADAATRLTNFLRSDPALQDASSAAFRAGVASVAANGHKPIIDIVAAHLPARRNGETLVVPIRWTVAQPADDDLPPLDADLQLRTTPGGGCELALSGSYRSPQPAVDPAMDRHTLDAVANATCLALLHHIATMW